MPRDSSGTYSLPDGYQAVTGELFVATQHNSPLEDIRDALTGSLARNGSGSMSAALDMNSNRIKNLADPTSDQDAATKTYVDGLDHAARVDVASAATTEIGGAASGTVRITGTTTITAFDTVGAGLKRDVVFGGILTLTHNATSLILPGGQNITTAAGDTARFISEGSGNWRCYDYERASALPLFTPVLPGYRNLTVQVTSATAISVSADSAILTDSVGRAKLFSTVSETIAITTDGAGGLDTGTEASSTWYAVFLIAKEDGTLDGLISASATAPTLPTGYTYFLRVGMVRNDSSGDLLRTIKRNDLVQYIIGTNPSAVITVLSGSHATATEVDLSSYVPSGAIEVDVAASASDGSTSYKVALGPNSASVGTGDYSSPLYANTPSNSPTGGERGRIVLETAQKLWGVSTGGGRGYLFGYRDSI